MLRTLELNIVTSYKHGETSRMWIFDAETRTFTHKSRRLSSGTRPPPRDFVENVPTEQDVQEYTIMSYKKKKMCVKCGNRAGGKYCIRRWCRSGYKYVSDHQCYFEPDDVNWNMSTMKYELK